MTQIDITLRGIPAERVAAVLAALGDTAYNVTVETGDKPHNVEMHGEGINTQKLLDSVLPRDYPTYEPAQVGTPTVGYGAQGEPPHFGNQPAGAVVAAYSLGGAPQVQDFGTHQVHTAAPAGESYVPYDPNVAAAIFGAKVEQAAPANTGAFASPAGVVTAPPLTNVAPVNSVGGGTPAPAGNWPPTCDLSLGFDSKGRPWDKRINSSGADKKLAKTQEWKLARNVDKVLVAQVQAELDLIRGAVAPNPAAAPQGVQRFNDQVVQPQHPMVHQAPAGAQSMPQAFATNVAAYVPPPVVAPVSGMTYGDIVAKCTGAIHAKRVLPLVMSGLLQHFGVKDIADLEKHADKWVTIASEIDRLSGAQ